MEKRNKCKQKIIWNIYVQCIENKVYFQMHVLKYRQINQFICISTIRTSNDTEIVKTVEVSFNCRWKRVYKTHIQEHKMISCYLCVIIV